MVSRYTARYWFAHWLSEHRRLFRWRHRRPRFQRHLWDSLQDLQQNPSSCRYDGKWYVEWSVTCRGMGKLHYTKIRECSRQSVRKAADGSRDGRGDENTDVFWFVSDTMYTVLQVSTTEIRYAEGLNNPRRKLQSVRELSCKVGPLRAFVHQYGCFCCGVIRCNMCMAVFY